MHAWSSFPLLRYVLWLIAGMVAAMCLSGGATPDTDTFLAGMTGTGAGMWWAMVAAATGYCVALFFRKRLAFFGLLQGVLGFVFLFSLGFGRMQERQEQVFPSFTTDSLGYWLAEAQAEGIATPKTIKVPLQLLASRTGGSWRQEEGSLMLYIRKDSLLKIPAKGDQLLVKMAPAEIPEPLNPNAFNYKAYMETQGICCQAFVTVADVRQLRKTSGGLKGLALEVRQWATDQLAAHVRGEQEEGIANALLLGYRELLDEKINQAYSTAGVMHVLAVSGLHVGFLYLFLQLLFRPWRRHPWLKWVGFGVSLLVLWSYAFITGLSPSVLRAVLMFSFVAFAVQLKRHSGIYNALAMAAFLLLLYDPFMLRAVGFQLSFLAVFGIVYLQPRFAGWYMGENRFIKKLVDLFTISLAAQLATFPLGLYYFGQFPTYFFLTNLLVVPAASLMLGLGFLFLFSSLISQTAAAGLGWLLGVLVQLVNKVVFAAEWLPFSSIAGSLTGTQLGLLMLFLLAVILLFHDKKFYQALLAAGLGVGLLSSFLYQTYGQRQQQKLVLYHMPGHSALHLADGREEYLYSPMALPQQQLKFTIRPNRIALGLASGKELHTPASFEPAVVHNTSYDLLVWRGYSLAYVHAPLPKPCTQTAPVALDFVVLAGNAVKDLSLLGCYFKTEKVLIDGSNQFYVQKSLQQQAESVNLPCYLTAASGAFELKR